MREDHDDTRALRALCRARKDLVETRVQILNQLRSNLELAFPGAIGLFPSLTARSRCHSCDGFSTTAQIESLSPARLKAWLKSVDYRDGISADVLYDRLTSAAPGLVGAEGEARARITLGPVTMIESLWRYKTLSGHAATVS